MVLCDSNVWLALALSKHSHHTAAREWLRTVEAPASVILCRATQQNSLHLLTNAAVLGAYGEPAADEPSGVVCHEALVADDRIAFRANEPADLEPLWKKLAVRGTASPKLWMDGPKLRATRVVNRLKLTSPKIDKDPRRTEPP